MRIGIDFDRVLFDTDSFKEELARNIEGFDETYEEAKVDRAYSHERHAEILEEDVEVFEEILDKSEQFLAVDPEFFRDFEHEIIVVTRGDPNHQVEKMKGSGILKVIDELLILNGNPEKNPKDQLDMDILIDDKDYELDSVDVRTYRFDIENHDLKEVLEEVTG